MKHTYSITIGSNDYNFDYDVNGSMLSEGDTARHLEYDCADRLRAFFVQTGTAEPSKLHITSMMVVETV